MVVLGLIGQIASALLTPGELSPRRGHGPEGAAARPDLAPPAADLSDHRHRIRRQLHRLHLSCPMLTQVTDFDAGAVSLVILLYGASVAIGNVVGGELADRMGAVPALTVIFVGLTAVLLAFGLTLTSSVGAVAAIAIWGGFAFANLPSLQTYTVQIARQVAPDAVDVASGLNIGAFNLGIAFDAWGRCFGPDRSDHHAACDSHRPCRSRSKPSAAALFGTCLLATASSAVPAAKYKTQSAGGAGTGTSPVPRTDHDALQQTLGLSRFWLRAFSSVRGPLG